MSTNVAILDYGSGNLRSAQRALERTGADVTVTSDMQEALNADGLVVPGVGAYEACMTGLREVRGERIIGRRLAGGRPVLGICVGMQILFERGVEFGVETDGCAEWPGAVTQLQATVLPHMGWNTVQAPESSILFDGLDADTRFYFVHSYAAMEVKPADTSRFDIDLSDSPERVSWCSYGRSRFVAAYEHGPLSATQFHPEKSGDAGSQLLKNWIATL